MPLKTVVRKHSAKVASFEMPDGDVRHYILIAGRWIYNGRKLLSSDNGNNQFAHDGFWKDSISEILTRNSSRLSFKDMAEQIKWYVEDGKPGKPIPKYYIRHWVSVKEEGCPF